MQLIHYINYTELRSDHGATGTEGVDFRGF